MHMNMFINYNIDLLISDGDDVGLVSGSVDTTAVVWRYTEGKVICQESSHNLCYAEGFIFCYLHYITLSGTVKPV